MNFLHRHKFVLITIIFCGVFVLVNPASAQVAAATAGIIGNIINVIVGLLGKVLVVLIHILVWIASYNDFVSSAAVTNGWVILRDVCNMFFIVILLVIAFATTLNIENYSWKKVLPKMLLMAVLINFSKLICGVFIDFAQVIMLTFVNGFRDIGGGNFADMLGIGDLLAINADGTEPINLLTVAGTYLLALMYIIVSIGVILVILFVLIMRIVMLWILVTLSPIAYLLGALPKTKQYADKWWSQFVENVVSGPILAFFIWLAFASATTDITSIANNTPKPGSVGGNEQGYLEATASLSKSGSPEGMLKFLISIGMLIGGVMITKDLGSTTGKAVGSAMKVNNWGIKKGREGAKNAGKATAQMGLRSTGAVTQLAGQGVSRLTKGSFGEATIKRGEFLSGWGKDIKKTQDDAAASRKLKTLNKFGIKKEGLKGLEAYEKASFGGKMTAATLSGSPKELYNAAVVRTIPMKWMGGKIKQFSSNYQSKVEEKRAHENINQTATVIKDLESNKEVRTTKQKGDFYEEHLQKRDSEISELQTEHTKKKQSLDHNESAELAEEKARFLDERAAMQAKGATPGEIKQYGRQYKKKLDTISERYSLLREKTDTDHDVKVADVHAKYEIKGKDVEAEIDATYKKNIDLAYQYHEKAKQTPNKNSEINTLNQSKTKDIDENEAARQAKLKDIRTVFAFSPAMIKSETAKTNDLYDKKAKDIHQNYETKSKDIDEKYKDALPVDKAPAIVTKLTDKAGNAMEQYDPLELTNAAIKKGLAAVKEAVEIFSAMGFKKLLDFQKSDFANGARGNNEKTTELWKMLAKGNSEANNKLTHMISQIEEVSSRGDEPNGKEKVVINAMKEGVGSFIRDNPDKKSSFTVFIEKLDKVDTGKKVDDFIQGKGGHK